MEDEYAISTEPDPPFTIGKEFFFEEEEEDFIEEPKKDILLETRYTDSVFQEELQGEQEEILQMPSSSQSPYEVPLEDGVTTPFFKRMIEEQNPLVEHILDFNLHRAKEIHNSHYEGIGKVLFSRGFLDGLMDSHRNIQYLTENRAILLGRATPSQLWYTDFSHYTHRFALLSGTVLEELSVYLGMTIFHKTVRKLIQKDGVQHVRGIFGKKATDFGIRRVSLFLHNIGSIYNIFHLPEYWAVEDQVRESGRYGLGLCVSMLPKLLQEEIALKLPRGFLSCDTEEPTAIGPDGFSDVQKAVLSGRLFPLLRKILILEVAPAWTPYFF